MTFDPEAATAAYMATLSPAAHAKATAYTHGSEWILLWSCLITVAAAWLIYRTVEKTLAPRIRRALTESLRAPAEVR